MKRLLEFVQKCRYMLAIAAFLGAAMLIPNPKPAVAGGVWCYVGSGQCDYDCDTGGVGSNCHLEDHYNGAPPEQPGG